MHYVYAHHRPGPDFGCFYIGKGMGGRVHSKKRNIHWHNVVQKHGGLRAAIVADFADGEAALLHEQELIELARAMGARLCNLTDGGDGARNPVPEVREKMAAAKRGKPRSFSPEHKAKLSASATGRKLAREVLAHRRRAVVNLDTGEWFAGMADAAAKLSATPGHICSCCQGKRRVAYGFRWAYADDQRALALLQTELENEA